MREVTLGEYLEYVSKHREVAIGGQAVKLEPIEVRRLEPAPEELADVSTTVWSFPKRGSWATHRGDYRGNWAPQVPRALMLMYTRPGDVVLDPMVGSGTTCVEAKLLGRNCIGVDINYDAVMLALHRLYYLVRALEALREGPEGGPSASHTRVGRPGELGGVSLEDIERAWFKVYHGDARNLDEVKDESVDLVATHPPYFNIIEYGGEERVEGDLSRARSLEEYLAWMREAAREFYRVLRPGRYCAILIGDTRAHRHYVPISHYVLQVFLDVGFILKEEVIKIQHKMKTTREVWSRLRERDFLLIYHEKLFVFRKPEPGEDLSAVKYSRKLGLG